ncbi:MAG: hypothetical protein GX167_03445 [Firmicutes bacterium]|nr:hypothetical protein [Bacillota bacterium]
MSASVVVYIVEKDVQHEIPPVQCGRSFLPRLPCKPCTSRLRRYVFSGKYALPCSLLKPKLIIVFGDSIREKVKSLIGKRNCECIYKPFPNVGDEEIYEEVRYKLKPYLKYVKETGFASKGTYNLEGNALRGNAVHLRFEYKAFAKMFNEQNQETPASSVEDLWHRNLVVPNMRRYTKLIYAFSFIENQIRVFLLDYVARTKEYTIFERPGVKPIWEAVLWHS